MILGTINRWPSGRPVQALKASARATAGRMSMEPIARTKNRLGAHKTLLPARPSRARELASL